jgi:hypothetical protein
MVRRIRKTKSPVEMYQESEKVTHTSRDNFRADGNAEETDYRMNPHTAREIARQLRLLTWAE